jgi:hypothetical protein
MRVVMSLKKGQKQYIATDTVFLSRKFVIEIV